MPVPTPHHHRGQDEGTRAAASVAEDSSASRAKAPFLLQQRTGSEKALDRRGGCTGRRPDTAVDTHAHRDPGPAQPEEGGVSCVASGVWPVAQAPPRCQEHTHNLTCAAGAGLRAPEAQRLRQLRAQARAV